MKRFFKILQRFFKLKNEEWWCSMCGKDTPEGITVCDYCQKIMDEYTPEKEKV